jgi:membrane protein DedA with SNARE-associated domain
MWIGPTLALATLVSEDATTFSAGALVTCHTLTAVEAVAWVAGGIWAGDVGLYLAGRAARRVPFVARWIDRRWTAGELASLAARLDRHTGPSVFASRFVPGTRVALYVAAGLVQVRAVVFASWAAVAATIWAAAIIAGTALIGRAAW